MNKNCVFPGCDSLAKNKLRASNGGGAFSEIKVCDLHKNQLVSSRPMSVSVIGEHLKTDLLRKVEYIEDLNFRLSAAIKEFKCSINNLSS